MLCRLPAESGQEILMSLPKSPGNICMSRFLQSQRCGRGQRQNLSAGAGRAGTKWRRMRGCAPLLFLRCFRFLSGKLKEINAADLFHKVEMPLLYVLADMEKKGVLVDM